MGSAFFRASQSQTQQSNIKDFFPAETKQKKKRQRHPTTTTSPNEKKRMKEDEGIEASPSSPFTIVANTSEWRETSNHPPRVSV